MGCASTKQTCAGAAGGGAAGKSPTLLACQAPRTQHRVPEVGSPHEATSSRGSPAKGAVAAHGVRFQAAGVCEEDDGAEPRRAARALISDQPAVVHVHTVQSFFTNATEPEEEGRDPTMETRRSAARKPPRRVTFQSEEDEADSQADEETLFVAIPWTRKATPWTHPEGAAAAADDDYDDEMPSLVPVPTKEELN
mmetsp:Transcript_78184/g.253811  ORF Transcript_78184/g.253811 Transcript_78184/m.253811 type:complete len:195 (-) Transcript_78184:263-847(-)